MDRQTQKIELQTVMKSENPQLILHAIQKAQESIELGGFPAGAIVVKDEKIVGEGTSIGNILHDPTSHGEIAAIRDACTCLNTSDLSDQIAYFTHLWNPVRCVFLQLCGVPFQKSYMHVKKNKSHLHITVECISLKHLQNPLQSRLNSYICPNTHRIHSMS